jgi:hypothetical protein
MDLIREITADARYPLHIYYANKDRSRIVGYLKNGERKLVKFSSPLPFDVRGRKFEVMKSNVEPDSKYFEVKEKNTLPVKQVAGSGGKMYTLTLKNGKWYCDCPGSTYRGVCRHSTEANSKT